jgi:hypothetical protein
MFVSILLTFWMYHRVVDRRQTAVVKAARRSQAIVGSLFPLVVHERRFTQDNEGQKPKSYGTLTPLMVGGGSRLQL